MIDRTCYGDTGIPNRSCFEHLIVSLISKSQSVALTVTAERFGRWVICGTMMAKTLELICSTYNVLNVDHKYG